jgi:integrase
MPAARRIITAQPNPQTIIDAALIEGTAMPTRLVDTPTTTLTTTSSALARSQQPSSAAQAYAEDSRAYNTKRAYRADWAHFCAWCEQQGVTSLPADPTNVGDYLSACARGDASAEPPRPPLTVATLNRRMAAISQAHQLANYASPTKHEWVRTVMKGIRRTLGTAQRQVSPAVSEIMRQWVRHLPDSLLGKRDRALLLLGFAGAFRRSEIAALDVADVRFVPEGMVITLRRSKTDQEGAGETKGIPLGTWAETCPVRTLKAYLKAAGITEGPLFRPLNRHGTVKPKRLNGSDIAVIIKRSAEAAGFEPKEYSGHSLRAGFATAAAAAGASDRAIKKQTGHKSDRVLQRYIREGALFRENAANNLGL